MLKFSKANAKLESLHDVPELGRWLLNGRKVYSLDLLSGCRVRLRRLVCRRFTKPAKLAYQAILR